MGIGQNIVMGEFRSVHLGSALHVLLHSSLSDGVFSSAAQLNAATSFILSRHSSSRHESKNEYQVTVSFKLMFPLLQNQNFSILLYFTYFVIPECEWLDKTLKQSGMQMIKIAYALLL